MGLFYTKDMFSFTELMLDYMPNDMQMVSKLAANFFTTSIFSTIFPDLMREHGANKKVDVRCGFSK